MAADAHLLTDLAVAPLAGDPARYAVTSSGDTLTGPLPTVVDLATVTGRDNLAQGITLRLLTPLGELAALGHPDYGSRIHEVLGRPNTPETRSLLRLHVLEALADEPRVAEVVRVDVAPAPSRPHHVTVLVEVRPVPPAAVVEVGPLTLELAR